jgi:predicted nucleic acid-binding protein
MIIIDTNVLLSFLLTNGITRRIMAENPDLFITPEYCFE